MSGKINGFLFYLIPTKQKRVPAMCHGEIKYLKNYLNTHTTKTSYFPNKYLACSFSLIVIKT